MPSTPSFASFVSAMQGISGITGVTRFYDEPPASLSTADLPAAFPLMPSGVLGERVTSCVDDSKTRLMDYVICVEAAGQGTQAQNYAALAAIMDSLEDKLDALTTANFTDYEIAANTTFAVADIPYWSIVASVSMRSS
jgi:hypothetical protein